MKHDGKGRVMFRLVTEYPAPAWNFILTEFTVTWCNALGSMFTNFKPEREQTPENMSQFMQVISTFLAVILWKSLETK